MFVTLKKKLVFYTAFSPCLFLNLILLIFDRYMILLVVSERITNGKGLSGLTRRALLRPQPLFGTWIFFFSKCTKACKCKTMLNLEKSEEVENKLLFIVSEKTWTNFRANFSKISIYPFVTSTFWNFPCWSK